MIGFARRVLFYVEGSPGVISKPRENNYVMSLILCSTGVGHTVGVSSNPQKRRGYCTHDHEAEQQNSVTQQRQSSPIFKMPPHPKYYNGLHLKNAAASEVL